MLTEGYQTVNVLTSPGVFGSEFAATGEQFDNSALNLVSDRPEDLKALFLRPFRGGWIVKVPRFDFCARGPRTLFGGLTTNSDDRVNGLRDSRETLWQSRADVDHPFHHHVDCEWVYFARRKGPCAPDIDARRSVGLCETFGHLAPGRVARAEE